ncbi:MAG: hypothetical protein IT288_08600 [Bdellovibrionales bacterium]|nr:hypothetical protein [Bdellovibrionales bacterium]
MTNKLKHLVVAGLILALWSCSEDTKPNSTDTTKFTSIYTNIIRFHNCHSCHAPGGQVFDNPTDPVELNFSTEDLAYSTLTSKNVAGPTSKGTCTGIKIVNTTPQTSFLAGVLFSEYNTANFAGVTGCTPYSVHLSDQNLSSSEKSAIVTWINNGAPRN